MLTVSQIRSITRPGVYGDGPGRYGLAVLVKAGAHGIRKVFVQRMTIAGRRTNIGLGRVEFVTLAEARAMAFENARANARGEPLPHGGGRRGGVAVALAKTFAAVADEYIKLQEESWRKGSRNAANWRSSLANATAIADRPVDSITTDDVIEVLAPVYRDRATLGRTLRQRIRAIFSYSQSKAWRIDNPADERLDAALPRNGHATAHRASVPHGGVAAVLAKVREIDEPKWLGAKLALEFLVLTGARSGEVLGMNWSEVEGDTWTVPASRMENAQASPRAFEHAGALRAPCGP